MHLITQRITRQDLLDRYATCYLTMTKAVIDVNRRAMAVDAEHHSHLEALLLRDGAVGEHLWGINLMLTQPPEKFIVFDSLINLRPEQDNCGTIITSPELRVTVSGVVNELVDYGQACSLQEPATGAYGPHSGSGSRLAAVSGTPLSRHHSPSDAQWQSLASHERVFAIVNELDRASTYSAAHRHREAHTCYGNAHQAPSDDHRRSPAGGAFLRVHP